MKGFWETLLTDTVPLLLKIGALKTGEAYESIKPHAKTYFKLLVLTIILAIVVVPFFIGLKMVTGIAFFGFIGTILALALTIIFGLLWSPIGIFIGMLTGYTLNPAEAGGKYVRGVAIVLFAELIASMYVWRVPFHQNLGNVPLLLMAAATVALGSAIWGGFISGRFYTFMAMVVLSLTTLSFFFPNALGAIWKQLQNMGQGKTTTVVIRQQYPQPSQPRPRLESPPPVQRFHRTVPEPKPRRETARPRKQQELPEPILPLKKVVSIQSDWSDWLELPPARTFALETPGEIYFRFPNGQVKHILQGESVNLGLIPDRHIQLKGTAGQVVFTSEGPSQQPGLTTPAKYPPKIVVPIRPDMDSYEVQVPDKARVDFNSSGNWLEFRFPAGDVIRISKGGEVVKTATSGEAEYLPRFPAKLPENKFRLRGDGKTVTIIL